MRTFARAALAVATLMIGSNAQARDWTLKAGKEPATGAKTAVIAAFEASARSPFMLGVKCRAGHPSRKALIIGSPNAFDKSADYPRRVPIVLRFDNGKPQTYVTSPIDIDGELGYVADLDLVSGGAAFLGRLARVKSGVAINVGNHTIEIPVTNSDETVSALRKACDLDGPSR